MNNKTDFLKQEEPCDKYINELNRERIQKTLKMIPEDALFLLDVGCGDGAIINNLPSFIYAVGLDINTQSLEYVNKNRVAGLCNVLPFKDRSFDIVVAAELLEHLDDQILSKTLVELQRVTRKYVLISVPFQEKPWETFVRCADCGQVYSPEGHQQYFDEERKKILSTSKTQTIKFCGTKKVLPKLKWIGQKLGIYSYRKNGICPKCGSRKLKYGMIDKIYSCGLFFFVKIFGKYKPNWILCLYEVEKNTGNIHTR